MKDKIFTVAIYAMLCCFMFGCFMFAGWRGFVTALCSAILYGTVALIIERDRKKQIESLDCHKGEVHNLRLTVAEMQNTIHLANTLLTRYGLSVKMPQVFNTLLPSVFDQRKK